MLVDEDRIPVRVVHDQAAARLTENAPSCISGLLSRETQGIGGAPGLQSDDLLESALAISKNALAYGSPDLFDLAAKYAASLTSNHPFLDGNKRIALTVAGVFLELNGQRLTASEEDAVSAMLALSTRSLDEAGFAAWLRLNTQKVPVARKKAARKRK